MPSLRYNATEKLFQPRAGGYVQVARVHTRTKKQTTFYGYRMQEKSQSAPEKKNSSAPQFRTLQPCTDCLIKQGATKGETHY